MHAGVELRMGNKCVGYNFTVNYVHNTDTKYSFKIAVDK